MDRVGQQVDGYLGRRNTEQVVSRLLEGNFAFRTAGERDRLDCLDS